MAGVIEELVSNFLALTSFYHKSYERQAVTKDLNSSSKFSGSSVLTLQTLLMDRWTEDQDYKMTATKEIQDLGFHRRVSSVNPRLNLRVFVAVMRMKKKRQRKGHRIRDENKLSGLFFILFHRVVHCLTADIFMKGILFFSRVDNS